MICRCCKERRVEVVAQPVELCNVCLDEFWRSSEGEHARLVAASFITRRLDEKKPAPELLHVWGEG